MTLEGGAFYERCYSCKTFATSGGQGIASSYCYYGCATQNDPTCTYSPITDEFLSSKKEFAVDIGLLRKGASK